MGHIAQESLGIHCMECAARTGVDEKAIPVQLIFLPNALSMVAFERMREVSVLAGTVPVVAWESLVLLKLYAGGPRDLLDAKQIYLAQAPDAAARAVVAALAERAGLVDEWEQFRIRMVQ